MSRIINIIPGMYIGTFSKAALSFSLQALPANFMLREDVAEPPRDRTPEEVFDATAQGKTKLGPEDLAGIMFILLYQHTRSNSWDVTSDDAQFLASLGFGTIDSTATGGSLDSSASGSISSWACRPGNPKLFRRRFPKLPLDDQGFANPLIFSPAMSNTTVDLHKAANYFAYSVSPNGEFTKEQLLSYLKNNLIAQPQRHTNPPATLPLMADVEDKPDKGKPFTVKEIEKKYGVNSGCIHNAPGSFKYVDTNGLVSFIAHFLKEHSSKSIKSAEEKNISYADIELSKQDVQILTRRSAHNLFGVLNATPTSATENPEIYYSWDFPTGKIYKNILGFTAYTPIDKKFTIRDLATLLSISIDPIMPDVILARSFDSFVRDRAKQNP